nr:MAG TPA: Ail/Lom protein [Caudoviricetes sp.]
MKKMFSLFVLLCICLTTQAQNEHLKFQGIAIDGNADKFALALEKKGYITESTLPKGTRVLKGYFVGKSCYIYLLVTPLTNTVWKVGITIDTQYKSWNTIKFDYNKYKELLSKKYGNAAGDYHYFTKPYYEGDGYEMTALANEKCTYFTFWDVPNGDIGIKMTPMCQIIFSYEDEINAAINKSETERISLDDL